VVFNAEKLPVPTNTDAVPGKGTLAFPVAVAPAAVVPVLAIPAVLCVVSKLKFARTDDPLILAAPFSVAIEDDASVPVPAIAAAPFSVAIFAVLAAGVPAKDAAATAAAKPATAAAGVPAMPAVPCVASELDTAATGDPLIPAAAFPVATPADAMVAVPEIAAEPV
jgi:hypothetical protein